jgi:ABC-type phosphate transport system substrate-binding protein
MNFSPSKSLATLCALLLLAGSGQGQTPAPIVIRAATPVPTASAAPVAPVVAAQGSTAVQAAIKSLTEMKATNAETIKKQEAALERLGEMQKAAEQLKVFSKRG